MLDVFLTPEGLISLSTLTILEIVLGIDNIVMVTIFASRLPKSEQARARRLGLFAALFSRIFLLFFISFIMSLTKPFFEISGHPFSVKDLILLLGGLFLLIKATTEIYKNVEHSPDENRAHLEQGHSSASVIQVILQIMFVDVIFSLDSVITAVGVAQHVSIMVVSVLIAVTIMIIFAKRVGDFIESHPSTKILALSFLVLIGVLLIAEGFGEHVNKTYVYFAMAFSLIVELLNMRYDKKKK